jgi:hypothetical protein
MHLQVGTDAPACKAATQLTRCEGYSCDSNGCNLLPLTRPQCSSCCGGTVRPVLSQCQFPFAVGAESSFKCVPSSSLAGAPDGESHWCRSGGDAFSRCDNACAQADFVGAQPSSCDADGFACAASGSAPTNVTIQIGRSGYGGDAGFRMGAEYTLVLFGAADHLEASAQLMAATGDLLYDGHFDSNRCDGVRRRRMGTGRGAEGGRSGESLLSVRAEARRRLEGLRLVTWWTELTGYVDLAWERRRFESDARWGGDQTPRVEPIESEGAVCARNAVASRTRVAVQRSAPQSRSVGAAMKQCPGALQPGSQAQHGGSGELSLSWDTLRAELGRPFELRAEHFPLELVVSGARASVRGRGAAGSELVGIPPELYFSLYTQEFDYPSRSAIWFGFPFGVVLGSCCCCCVLKCLFRKPRKAMSGRPGRAGMVTVAGRDSEMTDLGPHDHDPEMST